MNQYSFYFIEAIESSFYEEGALIRWLHYVSIPSWIKLRLTDIFENFRASTPAPALRVLIYMRGISLRYMQPGRVVFTQQN